MESVRPGEVVQAIEPGNARAYSPATYSSVSYSEQNSEPNNSVARPTSSSSQRAGSADVLAKRQQIANMIREAEEEEATNTLIGKSIDMVCNDTFYV